MNKQKFIEFVESPANIRQKDVDILTELARNYPYASLVHTMLAKAQKNSPEARESLAKAALYIPDRSVLKKVMENMLTQPKAPGVAILAEAELPGTTQDILSPTELVEQEGLTVEESEHPLIEKNNVLQELQENLQKLKEQRDRLKNPLIEEEINFKEKSSQESIPSAPPEEKAEKQFVLPERLQEIVENKEEKEILDPKKVEQISLIDNFIRNSSFISRKYRSINEPLEEQSDLTGKDHFTPPDLVTENLAQIMVRQGKTEKAIDIYEKLSLKYPQKKAYFASCIEKLKNS